MRSVLFNWIFDIHKKFKLKSRTLFMTCNIFDRYVSDHMIKRSKLQLVGAVCFLIASKYEDIYPPEIREIKYLCDNIYKK